MDSNDHYQIASNIFMFIAFISVIFGYRNLVILSSAAAIWALMLRESK
jgi:hypothetical protein